MTYHISRRVVLFGALPAACGLTKSTEEQEQPVRPPTPVTAPAERPQPVVDVRSLGASPTASAATNGAAFRAASRAIERAGGGTLLIPPGVYRVGEQERRGGKPRPLDIIRITGCDRTVLVSGTGATLKAADGLRYGAFDPVTGAARDGSMPFVEPDYRVDACIMIQVRHCTGDVRIEGVRLDGNLTNYVLGGQWGDTGRQVDADGIICEGNTGSLTIAGVHCREHGRDGIMLGHAGVTARSPRYPVTLIDVVCDLNGRQGLSWIGGNELTATGCRFTRTGRGRFASAPGAGVDIEAETGVCRNGRFVECEFVDNVGAAMVADSGDSADVRFDKCTFIGTTNWSAWPCKPRFAFRDCLFVGSIVKVWGSPDPAQATQFIGCRFHGDPALSPTRQVYGGFLGDLGAGATNVLMRNCDFRAVAPGIALLWTPADMRFDNCRFTQVGPGQSYPRGIFTGTNRIDSAGPVDMWGSQFLNNVVLNGRRLG